MKENASILYVLCSFFCLCKRILRQAQDKIPKEKHTGNDPDSYRDSFVTFFVSRGNYIRVRPHLLKTKFKHCFTNPLPY
jgi:hypothetical protein